MAEEPPKRKLASNKRIILCSDGTWIASDMGDKSVPSNVAKLARALANNGPDGKGDIMKQIVLYQSGLGTGDLFFQKRLYGGLGWGLENEVCQMYDFISNNYEPGKPGDPDEPGKPGDPDEPADELFFFGFSRGAFTVRSVAGVVCDVGILSAVHMSRFPEMWEAYRNNTSGTPFRKSQWYLRNKDELGLTGVRVKVVGVWVTVGALGIPEWPIVSLAKKVGFSINKKYAFHNTNVSKNLDFAFQALAIDENRRPFAPTLWHRTADSPAEDLQQCWFPGTHGNIGGGQNGALEEIGHNTFAWMVDNLSNMLTFEDAAINALIDEHKRALQAIESETQNGWGCGPLVNNFSGLGLFWRLLGTKARTPGAYARDPGDGTDGPTEEYFHPITRIRKVRLNYEPAPLQGYALQEADNTGPRWTKEGAPSIAEYVMDPGKTMSVAYEENGSVKYRVEESLSRRLCPSSIRSSYRL
ncbi:hypothetical protein C8A01DRAFT_38715 [Parachaetomium inaequale]|uniref:T6SS Phospholipase effector Tle1-like catalytic domain-containing protein n=1 Tax=Parachaetomium inaequale TaxID=2588326 RepID=A0AAN6PAQ2_9PEZI|nr:hypothetical protein C8A01DRAFT_38715 [Parachaetomium inaequale]